MDKTGDPAQEWKDSSFAQGQGQRQGKAPLRCWGRGGGVGGSRSHFTRVSLSNLVRPQADEAGQPPTHPATQHLLSSP